MKNKIFNDVKEYAPDSYEDHRGEIYTTWEQNHFRKNFQSNLEFNHDKISVSKKNVLRGLHGDFKSSKLMICTYGEIYYVLVDNRIDSKTFGKWDWEIISSKNKKMLLIPPGYGSAFLVLSDLAVVNYKWSYDGEYPDVTDQFTLKWDSPEYNIFWPIKNPILSERDA